MNRFLSSSLFFAILNVTTHIWFLEVQYVDKLVQLYHTHSTDVGQTLVRPQNEPYQRKPNDVCGFPVEGWSRVISVVKSSPDTKPVNSEVSHDNT